MAIPVELRQFRSSGVYKIIKDESQVEGIPEVKLRLVVGSSRKGPFNNPVLIDSVTKLESIFGKESRKDEKNNSFFHRTIRTCLRTGPVFALNLRDFNEFDLTDKQLLSVVSSELNSSPEKIKIEDTFTTDKFWVQSPETIADINEEKLLSIANISSQQITTFIQKTQTTGFDVTIDEWYKNSNLDIPEFLDPNDLVSDWMIDIYVFSGDLSNTTDLSVNPNFSQYFSHTGLKRTYTDSFGRELNTLENLINLPDLNFLNKFTGSIIPGFVDEFGETLFIETLVNSDISNSGLLLHVNDNILDQSNPSVNPDQRKFDLVGHNLISNSTQSLDLLSYKEETIPTGTTSGIYDPNSGLLQNIIVSDNVNNPKTPVIIEISDVLELTEQENKFVIDDVFPVSVGDLFIAKRGGLTRVISVEQIEVSTPNKPVGKKEITTQLPINSVVVAGGLNITEYLSRATLTISTDLNLSTDNTVELQTSTGTVISTTTWVGSKTIDELFTDLVAGVTGGFAINHVLGELTAEIIAPTGSGDTLNSDQLVIIATNPIDGTITQLLGGRTQETLDQIQLTWVKALDLQVSELQPLKLDNYTIRESQFVDGTAKRHNEILNVLYKEGIRKSLTNKNEIDFNYIVDSFGGNIQPDDKIQLAQLAQLKCDCLALLNTPSVKQFSGSKNPYFKRTPTSPFDAQYITTGGNPDILSSNKYSFASDGDTFAEYCGPSFVLREFGQEKLIPLAGAISNLYRQKSLGLAPTDIIAGPNRGRIREPGVIRMEYNFDRDDLNALEPFGYNAIIFERNTGFIKNSQRTAQQAPFTALNQVHVRELVTFYANEIEQILSGFRWEFNTPENRLAVLTKANSVLNRLINAGVVTEESFNRMDATNNTAEIIRNNIGVLDSTLIPNFGMGILVNRITISNGSISSEVL